MTHQEPDGCDRFKIGAMLQLQEWLGAGALLMSLLLAALYSNNQDVFLNNR